ncbi:hypothetical protein CHS0354_010417 [Potamilus streckersoni]|uniref:Uncharacterized protein n=1 Tax=Potamilus streckersoni TaxID=2493646 RepID=A0AAE0RQN7_9BIVA|nr:hypothetical protein CHS0354_010417 [Potamilus streckersoni]
MPEMKPLSLGSNKVAPVIQVTHPNIPDSKDDQNEEIASSKPASPDLGLDNPMFMDDHERPDLNLPTPFQKRTHVFTSDSDSRNLISRRGSYSVEQSRSEERMILQIPRRSSNGYVQTSSLMVPNAFSKSQTTNANI